MSNSIKPSFAQQQTNPASEIPSLEERIKEKANLAINLKQVPVLKKLFEAPLFNKGNIFVNLSRANNAGNTEKVISYMAPQDYKPGANEGNFTAVYENGLSDQSLYPKDVQEILNNSEFSDSQKFNSLIVNKNESFPTLLRNALMADVKGLDLQTFLANSALNNFSADEAKKGIGKLMHGALDLILKLDTLDNESKISIIKEMNLVNADELNKIAIDKKDDPESIVFHLLSQSPYKIRQIKSNSESGQFVREYHDNPNSPVNKKQRILKSDEGTFGGIPFSVSYNIPKSNRSSKDIADDLAKMEMTPNKSELEDLFSKLQNLGKSNKEIEMDATRKALTKSLNLDTEIAKDPVEQLLQKTYDNYSEPFRKTTSREEFLEILSKNLSRRVPGDYKSNEPNGILKEAFAFIKEKDLSLENTLEAALYETTQTMKKTLQGKLEYLTDPSNFKTHEEYIEAQSEYENLDPVLKSDKTIEKENEKLFKAAFGNRVNGKIPQDQLTTQRIELDGKVLEFHPEQDSAASEEIRMPSGVIVNIKGAQTKPSNDSFHIKTNGEHSISVSNGFVKMSKNGKLVSMITPNGVRLNMNENHKHVKDAYTLMSANRADGARASNHFKKTGPTFHQRQDLMHSSQRKMQEARKKSQQYSYGISNYTPNKVTNDVPVTQAFSPYGDSYTWNPMGNAVADITSSFFDTRQSKLVENKANIKRFNEPDRPIDYNGNNFNSLAT